ncbi:hypothetical protein BKA24_002838 [Microbacterium marinum]|uniref:Uncharacterized protein n=1 Tax=Microbacterium marinum TaxID=421115 RepID=A0A7W7BSP2_9MICO|nr:DUF6461 domain-containing protein [Microbacterium marinum]MBB4668129.1 hypothetical protein [Microbacterium marinum]
MSDYPWADNGELVACISVAVAPSTEDAICALQPDPVEVMSYDEARDVAWNGSETDVVNAITIESGRHVIIWEENGYLGSTEEPFQRLAEPGPAGSLFVNVNAVSRLMLGRGGRIEREFGPLFRRDSDEGEGAPLAAEASLDWSMGHYLSSSLRLIASYTGLDEPFDPEWLDSSRARHWLLRY